MEKGNAVQNTTWLERPCCPFMPLGAGSLYALLSMAIQLLSATAACAPAAPDEMFSALQSAAQLFPIHNICSLVTATGLSHLLTTFSLIKLHFCITYVFVSLSASFILKPSKKEDFGPFYYLMWGSSSYGRPPH